MLLCSKAACVLNDTKCCVDETTLVAASSWWSRKRLPPPPPLNLHRHSLLFLQMSSKRSNSFRRAILQGSRQLKGCSLRDEVGLGMSQRLVRHVAYETLPREVDRKWYFDSYNYCPPPWLILAITIAEVKARSVVRRPRPPVCRCLQACPHDYTVELDCDDGISVQWLLLRAPVFIWMLFDL